MKLHLKLTKSLLAGLIFCLGSWNVLAEDLPKAPAKDLPKDSLYQIQSQWKNQEGVETPLKEFSGKPVVMAMTYTGCQYSCPMTINKLEEIEKDFKKKGIQNYHFVVASFDTEKDTPKVLKAYMKKRKLNTQNWTFLSAPSDEEVRKLAVVLDISYQKVDGGDFSHSNAMTLLDSNGRIGLRLKGMASAHDELVEKVVSYEKPN